VSAGRNVLIVLGIAAAVVLLPGGENVTSAVVGALSAAFLAALGWFGVRVYRERRVELQSLEDGVRAILYGALGLALLTATATRDLWSTGPGTLVWFALVALVCAGLVTSWRAWRAY